MTAPRLLVADDHPLFRAALVQAMHKLLPEAEILDVDTFAGLQLAVDAREDFDLVLLDLHMPGAQGFSTLLYLRNEHPALPIIIVSGDEDPAVMQRALDFGASGYIPKSSSISVMVQAVRQVLDGGVYAPPQVAAAPELAEQDRELALRIASLSPQQFKVFIQIADGRLNKQIAADLNIMEATVKAHVTAILRKLGLVRRTQAALLAQRLMKADFARLSDLSADAGDTASGDPPED
jgi:DNA-binding NarL/FixJ family response regulator